MATPSRRSILGGTAAGAVGGLLGAATRAEPAAATGTRATRTRWVTSWATAQTAPTPTDPDALNGFTNTTIHHTLHLTAGTTTGTARAAIGSADGAKVRLRFAHPFGVLPVVLGPVSVASSQSGGERRVLFGGEPQVVIAAGATVVSDPVSIAVPDGGDLAVNMHLPGPTGPLSFHRNVHATGHVGDRPTNSVFLLTGVDVPANGRVSLAVLGDSITEGVGTPDNANLRWPDQYAARFRRRPAISNLGISGNRVLLDDARFGPSGQSRFDRDVLALPNIRTLVIFLGINDIQQPPSQTDPQQILHGYEQLVRRAHDHDLEVIGATIGPFKGWSRYTATLDQVRNEVNAVLRRGQLFDRLLDVDAALRDPADPAQLRPAFNSGDGLHPNPTGAQAIAAIL
ncbi:MAG TPA: GDSL-type esterase/lipase family protein [Kribbella sp.]|nr:GDSL-type esterase/lipase family protein [Kribbella sp.]